MGLEHPPRTDAKVEATDRPRPSDKPPGPPPDNPGAPGYPSRRESLARAREPAPQEGETQQPAVKDSGARGTDPRDNKLASPQADTGKKRDESTGPEAPDREGDAAKQDVEAGNSEPAEKAEQPDQDERDERDQQDEGEAERSEGKESEQTEAELDGGDAQDERDGKPANAQTENGGSKIERPQEQGSAPEQDQKPGTDEPPPTSESGAENARALGEGDAREPATQPGKTSGIEFSTEPDNTSEGFPAPESPGNAADDLDSGTTHEGSTDDIERLEGFDEGALERGISDRLKRFAAKLDRSDEPKELEGTVDRPNFQDPKAKPEVVPDRYGAPLDQVDGTRTPLFEGEPRREQTKQGLLGDCGIIATLGAVAAYHPEAIRSCVRETDDGNYQVRFHEARYSTSRKRFESTGQSITLTVTPELPIKDERPGQPAFARFTREKAAWVPVLEKAIAGTDQVWSAKRWERVNEIWRARGNSGDAPTGYVRLNQGSGFGERAELLTQLTGLPAKSVPFPEGYDNQGRSADRRLRDDILKQLSQEKPVLVGTRNLGENESRLPRKLIDGHVYEVTEIDDKGRLHLRNPWNNRHPEPMAIQEFKRGVKRFYSTLE